MSDSENSDDCEGLLKKALDVELPLNFNPNSIPQNGEEYLHHVIYERSKCKKLVTVDIDRSKFLDKQTVNLSQLNIVRETPVHCAPTEKWQCDKVKDFRAFREFVHAQMSVEPSLSSFDEEKFIEKVNNDKPFFSDITRYSQSSKIRMLQKITKHLDSLKPGESIEDNLGTWVYAILTLLEIPLSPSCCHTLREFARKCSDVRSKLPEDVSESLYTPLNLFICIVAKFFNQLDLAD